jgi:hypothetical protein
MNTSKIYTQKGGALNDEDRLTICRLLIKAGYTVRVVSEKVGNTSVKIVEYWR